MTAGIYFSCDKVKDEYGSTCTGRLLILTTDLDLARRDAATAGWIFGSSTDLCPSCSGRTYRLRTDLPPGQPQPRPRPDQVVPAPLRHLHPAPDPE